MFRLIPLSIIAALLLSFDVHASPNDIDEAKCGIENCHGLDIVCGENVPEFCTTMYALGDRCRRYAQCAIIEGECVFVENEKFNECKTCMQKCLEKPTQDVTEKFACESQCGLFDEENAHEN